MVKQKNKLSKSLQSLIAQAFSLVVVHCEPTLNMNEPLVRFPSENVSLLLVKAIAQYNHLRNAGEYALCQLCGSMKEDEMQHVLGRFGALAKQMEVRKASLEGLAVSQAMMYPQSCVVKSRVWIICHDIDEKLKGRARDLWSQYELKIDNETLKAIMSRLGL